MSEKVIHILLVDDYAIVRDGLAALLNRQNDMQVVAEAVNGKEAILAYRHHRPDVTLMDVSMPEMDGLTATALLVNEFPDACILILSSVDNVFDRGLQAGARACLLKDSPHQELMGTIRQLHQKAVAAR